MILKYCFFHKTSFRAANGTQLSCGADNFQNAQNETVHADTKLINIKVIGTKTE